MMSEFANFGYRKRKASRITIRPCSNIVHVTSCIRKYGVLSKYVLFSDSHFEEIDIGHMKQKAIKIIQVDLLTPISYQVCSLVIALICGFLLPVQPLCQAYRAILPTCGRTTDLSI